MIIENQDAAHRFVALIDSHWRRNDRENLSSTFARRVTDKRFVDLRYRNPFQTLRFLRRRTCPANSPGVIIKLSPVHAFTLRRFANPPRERVRGIFESPARREIYSLVWLTGRGHELPIQIPTRNTNTPPTIT